MHKNRLSFVFVILLGWGAIGLGASRDPVRNPGFEDLAKDGDPLIWTWGISQNAEARTAVDEAVFHAGKRSVRLSSETPESPHVYGGLWQKIEKMRPMMKYRLSFWAKGQGAGTVWVGGGPDWMTRVFLPHGTFDWRLFTQEFITERRQTSFELRINVDSVTEALWVDDFLIEPIEPVLENGKVTLLSPEDMVRDKVALLPLVEDIPKLGSAAEEWDRRGALHIRLPQDDSQVITRMEGSSQKTSVQGEIRALATQAGIEMCLSVQDDVFHQTEAYPYLWTGDSIQVAFDPQDDRRSGNYGNDDVELTLAVSEGQGLVCGQAPSLSPEECLKKGYRIFAHQEGSNVLYQVFIPWAEIGLTPEEIRSGKMIGFDLLLNDNDGAGRLGWVEWTPGIGISKNPASFATLVLSDPSSDRVPVSVSVDQQVISSQDVLSGDVLLVLNDRPVDLRVDLSGPNAFNVLQTTLDAKSAMARVHYGAESVKFPEGDYEVVAMAQQGDRKTESSVKFRRENVSERLLKRFETIQSDHQEIAALLQKARDKKLDVQYPLLSLKTVDVFIPYIQEDLDGNLGRAAEEIADVETLLEKARTQLKSVLAGQWALSEAPRYKTSSVFAHGYHFEADVEYPTTGRQERGPVFFNGYGHFGTARETIPDFPDLGANIVQLEVGPISTLPNETDVDLASFHSGIMETLDKAAQNNVMLCVLLSPHYFPQWAYEKWPEIGRAEGGFLRFSVDHPMARTIIEKHIRAVTHEMAGHPALHSVCLSNEPIYRDTTRDGMTQHLWREYVKQVHGSLDSLNAVWGTGFPAFEAIQVPLPAIPMDKAQMPMFYDWCRFNQLRFSGWHAWMRSVVQQQAPTLACHTKVMATHFSRDTITWGTSAEDFARVSDYNGNDCSCMFAHQDAERWAEHWQTQAMYYDLECSFLKAPVVNTENHIITDRDTLPIPGEHIYTALWQGAVHGQGASMVWVWERTHDPVSDFCGSILHRPLCVEAAGRAQLDMMRLRQEMVAIQDEPRRVALLYSVPSIVWDEDHIGSLCRVYEALAPLGIPIRFVSERQLIDREWGDLKSVILPEARHVPEATLAALRAFGARGSVLAVGDHNLEADEYGKPFQPESVKGIIARTIQGKDRALSMALAGDPAVSALLPAVRLVQEDGGVLWGSECKAARVCDQSILNSVNYTRAPLKGRLVSADGKRIEGEAVDLITGEKIDPEAVELKTMVPRMMRVR